MTGNPTEEEKVVAINEEEAAEQKQDEATEPAQIEASVDEMEKLKKFLKQKPQ